VLAERRACARLGALRPLLIYFLGPIFKNTCPPPAAPAWDGIANACGFFVRPSVGGMMGAGVHLCFAGQEPLVLVLAKRSPSCGDPARDRTPSRWTLYELQDSLPHRGDLCADGGAV